MITNLNINQLPKKTLYIGGSIAVLIILYIIVRKVSKIGVTTTETEAKREIQNSDLSYTEAEFAAMSDRIEKAVSDIFDNETSIYDVFGLMNTKSDVLALIVAYGKRWYVNWVFPTKDNLPATLATKLSTNEIAKINKILTDKGINFKF